MPRTLALILMLSFGLYGLEKRSLEVNGIQRDYLVFRPSKPTGAAVLAFHGGGGTADGMDRLTALSRYAERQGMLVAYPQGIGRHWGDARSSDPSITKQGRQDVQFIRRLIDELISRDHIDPARVYATGISNGGFFSFRLACELGDRIAAIAPVAATMPIDPGCRQPSPIPVLLIHGDHDPLVPAAGGPSVGLSRYKGPAMSATASAGFWAKTNRCQSAPETTKPAPGIVRHGYSGCSGGAVIFYEVVGGGHTWPGGRQYLPVAIIGKTTRELDASEVILSFFSKIRRR